MITQARREHSESLGIQAEAKFVAACNARGYACHKSSKAENTKRHIDFYVTRSKDTVTVDVKGNNTPEMIWIELKNIYGHDGWLYGDADYIAFDMNTLGYFAMMRRYELVELCDRSVVHELVGKIHAYHKLYTRAGRKDVITRFILKDLTNLKSFTILNYAG